jgi:NADPH2:quinone reductase
MSHAIRVHQTGGAEQLRWQAINVGEPGPGEARVRNVAIGLNFIDTYFRSGLYPAPLPFTPGMEGAGVVEAVGPGVTEVEVGDRVGYIDPLGAYAEVLLRPVQRLIPLPAEIGDEQAAALLLKGLTAQYLLRSTYRVQAGETILVHAAAGGVGQILCQWARHLGATVIGAVGSADKVAVAQAAGCHHVIDSSLQRVSEQVRNLTGGSGVPVVYDGIGAATFTDSLACLRPRGLMVSYGNASGPVEGIALAMLAKGSLYVTRPGIAAYNASRGELLANAAELFDAVRSGAVSVNINQRYPLREAAVAHADLQARRTTGSTVLLP